MVPMERAPAKVLVAVVVERRLPTVSCVPVAIMTPEELVVTMELIGRGVREVKGREPEILERESQEAEIA